MKQCYGEVMEIDKLIKELDIAWGQISQTNKNHISTENIQKMNCIHSAKLELIKCKNIMEDNLYD
jgi:hypothetical protein